MGYVHIIRDFASPQEGISRTVRIYTPDAYDHAPERRFPVLYMHDGQNVFAHPESAIYETWCANATMDALVAEGRVEPWIIVAVDSTHNRLAEYSPWDEPRSQVRAHGHAYVRFVTQTTGCRDVGRGNILVTRTPTTQLCRGDIATTVDSTSRIQTGACSFGDFIPYRRPR